MTMALLAACVPRVHAQAFVPDKGHGSIATDYQQVLVEQNTDSHGHRADLDGKIQYRTVHLNLDYGFADRWAVSVSLPFGSNRDHRNWAVPPSHDPGMLPDPHGQHLIDDDHYHAGWKDWNVGLRYQWITDPLAVTPFVKYGFPTHDYQYYGESALGLHQTELQAGLAAAWRFPRPWQNLYLTVDAAYEYMQKKGPRRVNHAIFDIDMGYFFTPRLSLNLGLTHRISFNGLDFPAAVFNPDGTPNFDVIFHHDTLRNVSYTDVHASLDYDLGHNYTMSLDTGKYLGGDNANLVKSEVSMGVSRGF